MEAKTMHSFSKRFPLIFSLAAILFFSFLTEIPLQSLFAPAVGPLYADYLTGIIEQFIATALVVLLGFWAGMKGRLGFSAPLSGKSLVLGWPLLLFALINCPEITFEGRLIVDLISLKALTLFILYLSTGFIEEGLFRGLVSGVLRRSWAKDRKSLYLTVLVSSLLFGLTHFVNLFQHRYTPLASLTQVLFGIFFGVFFEALYLRTGSLFPGIILHALFDFSGNLTQLMPGALPRAERIVSKTSGEALISIGITLPLFLIGLFMLRKVRPEAAAAGAGTEFRGLSASDATLP
jgi:membrane protease YdiL (CAAX protease family)